MGTTSSAAKNPERTIFVIGGTGAQGMPIVRTLLARDPSADAAGDHSTSWNVRVLTRDPSHHRAKELESLGAELVVGGCFDYDKIRQGMEGAYGVFVNIDGFSIGEMAESHVGMRIFEIAKQARVRHYVWSSLDDVLPVSDRVCILRLWPNHRTGSFTEQKLQSRVPMCSLHWKGCSSKLDEVPTQR